MRYLNQQRIIYRREPITDIPTETYEWGSYYENGTHECYDLFRSRAKITTYKSLKWHMLVLWYLNPDLTQDDFELLCRHLTHKPNGFVTFEVSEQLLKTMIYDVSMCDLDAPPKNKLRKILFKEFCGLSLEQKLHIVGQMVGRSKSIQEDDIYQCMLDVHDLGQAITINKLSSLLKCSTRTIHRNMSIELKKEKELLNKEL
jgi:hypothetical protein|tara:strand:- start:9939 stop:10541 length:603 start_codon:yes stop_codon:yes gene_type:complete